MKKLSAYLLCLFALPAGAQQLNHGDTTTYDIIKTKGTYQKSTKHPMISKNNNNSYLSKSEQKNNVLFQYGTADSFVGGIFEADYSIGKLKQHGNFGLGAPGMLDGELTITDGHVYQTQATGKTTEVADTFKTALAFVTFFKADTVFHISGTAIKKDAFEKIDQYLKKKNGMYAIRITGNFNHITTRAFPPYTQQPYPPLATLISTQKFFNVDNIKGVMVGYKLPDYLNSLSISGYHFHFMADDKSQGGHVTDFTGTDLQVEIAELTEFHLSTPQDSSFMNYNFNKRVNSDLDKVEKGH